MVRRRQWVCTHPACPRPRPNKRTNIEAHVWTQHVRRIVHGSKGEPYQPALHKALVQQYLAPEDEWAGASKGDAASESSAASSSPDDASSPPRRRREGTCLTCTCGPHTGHCKSDQASGASSSSLTSPSPSPTPASTPTHSLSASPRAHNLYVPAPLATRVAVQRDALNATDRLSWSAPAAHGIRGQATPPLYYLVPVALPPPPYCMYPPAAMRTGKAPSDVEAAAGMLQAISAGPLWRPY